MIMTWEKLQMNRGDETVLDPERKTSGTARTENGDVTSVNEKVPKVEKKLKKETEKKIETELTL